MQCRLLDTKETARSSPAQSEPVYGEHCNDSLENGQLSSAFKGA